jgi:hypothetical protein
MAKPTPPSSTPPPDDPYTVERVRQGQIILRKPWERVVFFAGLIAAIVLGLVMLFVATR